MVNSGVIVTGGASGIGLATIEALLAHDDSFYILLADRDKANGKKQAKRLNGFNGESHPTSLPALRVLFIETDVSSEASIVSLLQTGVSWLASHDAPLRYLINSAGCDFIGTFGDPKLNASALFDRAVAVNLRSVYLLCHHCTPLLAESAGASAPSAGKAAAKPAAKKQKVAAKATPKTAPPPSSSIATRAYVDCAAYAATKGGINALTTNLAPELGLKRIRVNAVCPGAVKTNIDANSAKLEGQDTDATGVVDKLKTGELMTGQEASVIGEAIVSLLLMRGVTGQMVVVDGGCSLLGYDY